jgi:signal peptidase II
MTHRPAFFLLISGLLITLDQLSKWAVTEFIIRPSLPNAFPAQSMGLIEWLINPPARLGFSEITVLPFFNWVMVWNMGISFGMFNRETDYGPLILTVLSILITIIFVIWLYRAENRLQSLAIAMVIGGAIGNAFDRIRFGAVIDFLDFHAFGYHWPAFNIADSCIVVGVFILIFHSFFTAKKPAEN